MATVIEQVISAIDSAERHQITSIECEGRRVVIRLTLDDPASSSTAIDDWLTQNEQGSPG